MHFVLVICAVLLGLTSLSTAAPIAAPEPIYFEVPEHVHDESEPGPGYGLKI